MLAPPLEMGSDCLGCSPGHCFKNSKDSYVGRLRNTNKTICEGLLCSTLINVSFLKPHEVFVPPSVSFIQLLTLSPKLVQSCLVNPSHQLTAWGRLFPCGSRLETLFQLVQAAGSGPEALNICTPYPLIATVMAFEGGAFGR